MGQIISFLFLVGFVYFAFFAGESEPRDPCADTVGAYFAGQEFVKRKLRSPSTADFPYTSDKDVYITIMDECEFHVRGYVDAQNGFGATVRTNYSLLMEYSRQDKKWRLISISL